MGSSFRKLMHVGNIIDEEKEGEDYNQSNYSDPLKDAEECNLKYGNNNLHIENLPMYEITSLKTIGSGAFSIVKKGFSKKCKKDIAVKIILLNEKGIESYIRKYLQNEISLWKELSSGAHVNILNLVEAIEVGKIMYIIMDLADRGDLDHYLLSGPMTTYKAKVIFKDIVEAVNYCHGKNIAHRDIKPQNLLLDAHDRIRLAGKTIITPIIKRSYFVRY